MTWLYGLLRASRILALGLVALWYGATAETDAFLLAYAVAAYVGSIAMTTLGEALVPHMRGISWAWLVASTMAVATVVGGLGYAVAGPTGLAFAPFAAFTVAASGLSGWRSAHGGASRRVTTGHAAALTVFLLTAFLTRPWGLHGIVASLTAGEAARLAFLLPGARLPLTAALPSGAFVLIAAMALFGLNAPLARWYALPLGEGYASLYAYISSAWGLVATFAGTGLMVQRGFHWARAQKGVTPALALAPFLLLAPGVGVSTMAALAVILAFRVPAFLMNARMLPALVARKEWRFLLSVAVRYAVAFAAGGYLAAQIGGITALAAMAVGLELWIAFEFRTKLRRVA